MCSYGRRERARAEQSSRLAEHEPGVGEAEHPAAQGIRRLSCDDRTHEHVVRGASADRDQQAQRRQQRRREPAQRQSDGREERERRDGSIAAVSRQEAADREVAHDDADRHGGEQPADGVRPGLQVRGVRRGERLGHDAGGAADPRERDEDAQPRRRRHGAHTGEGVGDEARLLGGCGRCRSRLQAPQEDRRHDEGRGVHEERTGGADRNEDGAARDVAEDLAHLPDRRGDAGGQDVLVLVLDDVGEDGG